MYKPLYLHSGHFTLWPSRVWHPQWERKGLPIRIVSKVLLLMRPESSEHLSIVLVMDVGASSSGLLVLLSLFCHKVESSVCHCLLFALLCLVWLLSDILSCCSDHLFVCKNISFPIQDRKSTVIPISSYPTSPALYSHWLPHQGNCGHSSVGPYSLSSLLPVRMDWLY